MKAIARKLRQRFVRELPLFRLRSWQFVLLLLWAAWPWLAQSIVPGNEVLAFGPVIFFMPFFYLGGVVFVAAFPWMNPEHAWDLGVSVTIFFVAYLCIVSWRQRRVRRAP